MTVRAWLQCQAGASGDMLLGAFLDAGAPLDVVRSAVGALAVEPIEIRTRRATRHGIAATKADVHAPQTSAPRTWPDVRALLEAAQLPGPVRERALDVFARLARAEARAHDTSPERVHFHEVGALDALADIVGTCAALHALGVTEVTCSPVALGTGTAHAEHGTLPVPGPAVLELLREAGAPVYTTELPYELCTPTGAALLAACVTRWGGMPPMRVHASGAGAGARDLPGLPNVARAVLGEPVAGAVAQAGADPAARDPGVVSSAAGEHVAAEHVAAEQTDGDAGEAAGGSLWLLETNVDDLDPRVWPAAIDRLLAAGAVDAWLTPILMKKGRPAHTLSVLATAADVARVRSRVFRETSTLGLRERQVRRTVLDRTEDSVDVDGHTIRVKLAYFEDELLNSQPEYDDVVAAAGASGRPVRDVLAEAAEAARARRRTRTRP